MLIAVGMIMVIFINAIIWSEGDSILVGFGRFVSSLAVFALAFGGLIAAFLFVIFLFI